MIGHLTGHARTFDCVIVDRHKVNGFANTITFRTHDQTKGVKSFYSDISMIGKHYLVRMTTMPKVKRHYTISNCMKKEVFNEYMSAIKS